MPVKQLESDLLNYIVANNLQGGDRLPSLADLSTELNVSVGKLREQLEVARILNMVGVKPRAGIQINDFDFAATLRVGLLYGLSLSDKHFDAYKELRNETTAAFWIRAVSSLTAEDLTDIRALIAKAWDKLNNPRIQIPHEEHRTFHLALLKHLDNPFVVGVEEGYWCAYEAVELNRYFDYQYLTTVWNYHERMINLIEQKKFEDSRLIFVEHTKLLIADGQRTT